MLEVSRVLAISSTALPAVSLCSVALPRKAPAALYSRTVLSPPVCQPVMTTL